MDTRRWQRLQELFEKAADLPEDERESFLSEECGGDPALAGEVRALIRSDESAGSAIEEAIRSGAADGELPLDPVSIAGREIGPYRIGERIGEGGFGEVYEAEQTEPVRRLVALKIVKAGMDSRAVVRRFAAEKQTLALMSHPHVAKFYDSGVTESGRSFFVMELVRGTSITSYCDEHALSVRARLDVFLKACRAVEHAHRRGIIHRDLKPSNILVEDVDGAAHPKVIDFGIAKAAGARPGGVTMTVQNDPPMGTPAYMSPEQAEADPSDIDTRADVYSLGVVLYELTSGLLPIDSDRLRGRGADEVRRILTESEAPRPSTRLRSDDETRLRAARLRGVDPAGLLRQLRGDLDWIVLKAIDRDRSRRYDSVSDLADDIRRHLENRPVLAGPPDAMYRFRKFAVRNRGKLLAASLVLLALLVGVSGLGVGLVRAKRAEERARIEAATSGKVSEFLIGLFRLSDPMRKGGSDVTVKQILDKGASSIAELKDEPVVMARLLTTMGIAYSELGLYPSAREQLEEALAAREEALDADHPEVGESLTNLANILRIQGEYDEARACYEKAIPIKEKAFGSESPELERSLYGLALTFAATGDFEAARTMYERTLAVQEKMLGEDDIEVATTLNALAGVQVNMGDLESAMRTMDRSIRISEANLGADHPRVAGARVNLAICAAGSGDYERARELCERSLPVLEKALGPDHPQVAATLGTLAEVSRGAGDSEAATRLARRSLAIWERALGPDHPQVAESLDLLAGFLEERGEYDEAAELLGRVLSIREAKLGPGHPLVAGAAADRARILRLLGRTGEADSLDARAAAIREQSAAENPR